MRRPVRRQVPRVRRLARVHELSEVLLRLQVLLTEADLCVLAPVAISHTCGSHHHAGIVRDCLQAGWAVRRVGLLLAEILVPGWHAVATR